MKLYCVLCCVIAISATALAVPPDESKSSECIARMTFACDFPLRDAKGENGTKVKPYSYNDKGTKTYVICAERSNANPKEWEEFKFSFVPSKDGALRYSLNAVDRRGTDKKSRKLAVYFDEFKIGGKYAPNGGFENSFAGFSFPSNNPSRIECNPNIVKFGKKCLRTWAHSYTGSTLSVKAGQRIEISAMTRPAGEIVIDDDTFVDISQKAVGEGKKLGEASSGWYEFDTVRFAPSEKSILFPENAKKIAVEINLKGKNIAGKYIYILHSFKNLDMPENCDMARVIVKNSDGSVKKNLLAAWRDIVDANAYKPANNAKAVFFSKPNNKKGAVLLSRFDVPSDFPIDSILFNTWGNGEWKIYAVTVSDKKINPFETWSPSPEEWAAADIPDNTRVLKGSALDLGGFFHDGEAGKFGRVIVSERGTFAFEQTPSVDIRFKSFMMGIWRSFLFEKTDEGLRNTLKEYAELIKRTGYNAVRIDFDFLRSHKSQKNFKRNLDMVDYFMSELKRNGIYVHYVIGWRDFGFPEEGHPHMRDEMKMRCVFCDTEVLEAWKYWAQFLLNHVNPYTKLALKDDPQIIQVEYFNELSITLGRMARMPDSVRDRVLSIFQGWLKQKYGTIENLNAAWNTKGFVYNSGSFKYGDFSEIKTFFQKNPDWVECALVNKKKFFEFCTRVVRETGYTGIIASENIGGSPAQTELQFGIFDSTIINTYFSHPTGLMDDSDKRCAQRSAVSLAFPGISNLVVRHMNDRPAGITEYNYCFWNKYRHEILALYAPYCAFQDYSMMTLHENAVPYKTNCEYKNIWRLNPFTAYRSPMLRASELFATCFFARGDVATAKHRVDMFVSKDFIRNNKLQALKAYNIAQSRLGLITGFRTDCEGGVPAALAKVKERKPDFKIEPIGSSTIIENDWFQTVVADKNSSGFDVVKFEADMRKRGVLDGDNRTNFAKGIFQTDTNQIYLNSAKKLVKITTPNSEMVSTESGKKTTLGALTLLSSSTPATIGVCSLDGRKISESSRLVLTYATQEANTDMCTSFSGYQLVKWGHCPILLKTGVLKVNLKLDSSKKYELYPLALSGERRAPIPFEFDCGVMNICIDTSKLPNGATTLFEIAELK